MVGRVSLSRRGVDHGQLAVVDPAGIVPAPPPAKRRRTLEKERWGAARPLVLPGALAAELAREPDEHALEDLWRRLSRPAELAAWVRSACKKTRRFQLGEPELELEDLERDLARVGVSARRAGSERDDLWVKSGRLSLHAPDRSLRVRVSFGVEGADDESQDEEGHRLVGELGAALLPGARALARAAEPRATLERLLGTPVLFTQAIGYWNAPEGGARMHHDAFGDPHGQVDAGTDPSGQLGVAYAQLSGSSAWVALSIADLAERVTEFLGWLEEGDAPWIVEEALGGAAGLAELLLLAGRRRELTAELALPGCGRLGPLVERGSEFTGTLLDAGHACVLRPGDVILLPNHGTARTAMHAVFSGTRRPGFGISSALRSAAPVE